MSAENKHNHIFNVDGKHLRGFLDIKSKEIVIFDDFNGKELFRIGNNHPSIAQHEPQEQYEKAIISLEVRNATNTRQTAILFASNREPLIQPLGITVRVKEIQNTIFDSHNYLRRDILTSPIKLRGMKYFVSNPSQFDNIIQFGYVPPYGKMKFYDFHPQDYISVYQEQNSIVEVPEFSKMVDASTQILVPVNPQTTCTLQFTALFKKANGKPSRKNIYTRSPSSQSNFIDSEANSIYENVESGNREKSIFSQVLFYTALLSFGAFIIYKINKIEGRLPI